MSTKIVTALNFVCSIIKIVSQTRKRNNWVWKSFKQIPVPSKIYADFECNLTSVESYEGSYTKKYQDHIPCSFAYKVVCVDDRFNKLIVVYRGENAAYEFIKAVFKEYKYCKKVMSKQFNKYLVMSEKE